MLDVAQGPKFNGAIKFDLEPIKVEFGITIETFHIDFPLLMNAFGMPS